MYPLDLASEFDKGKIGLQFGSLNAEVKKIIVCLDATDRVIDEAIENDANLIISHHPFMFVPMMNLNYDTPFGKKITKVISNKLNIMAFHTNFDVGLDGMNDVLANKLGLQNVKYITDELNNDSFIRWGECEKIKLVDFCEVVKKVYKQKTVKVAGNLEKIISKVAIVGGSGSSEYHQAFKSGADVYITGQLRHELGIEACENNFALIEVSHAVEYFGIENLKEKLVEKFTDVVITMSKVDYDPFKIV